MSLEDQPASNFSLMFGSMMAKWAEWQDEMTQRAFGFRISELRRMEELVAWYATTDTLTDEGKAERDRLLKEYKAVWRPRRDLLQRRKAGMT